LSTSQLHCSKYTLSSLLKSGKVGPHVLSETVIVGGNISSSQHTIAGIHSKIGTPSGGAHLNIASSLPELSTVAQFAHQIFCHNNCD
jgi:hypothetical protein